MKLFYTNASPYARKCRVVIIEKGLQDRVELLHRHPFDQPSPPDLLAANPLGRVPALITDEGMALVESNVICDYLDSFATPHLIPRQGAARYMVLGLLALADGILDATVQCVLESRRPEALRNPDWTARKEASIRRTLALLAPHMSAQEEPFTMATIGLAAALGYLSFRLPYIDWRGDYPPFAAFYDKMAARPSFQKTQPVN